MQHALLPRCVSASGAVVEVAAERRRTAAPDGPKHLVLLPGDAGSAMPDEASAAARKMSATSRTGRLMRPLPPRRLGQPVREYPADSARPQVPVDKMEVDHRVAWIVVAEQSLQDGQFGAVVEQVSSETVPPMSLKT